MYLAYVLSGLAMLLIVIALATRLRDHLRHRVRHPEQGQPRRRRLVPRRARTRPADTVGEQHEPRSGRCRRSRDAKAKADPPVDGPPSDSPDKEVRPRAIGQPPRPIPVYLPRRSGSAEPGYAADSGMVGPFTVRAASCRGRTHAYRGELKQDAYAIAADASGWFAVAVADGLGSARHADRAAHVAADEAVRVTVAEAQQLGARVPDERWWQRVLGQVATYVDERTLALGPPAPGSNAQGRTPRQPPATTLTVALGHENSPTQMWVAAVGDSPAYRLTEKGWTRYVSDVGEGPIASLPRQPDASRCWSVPLGPGDVLVLASDGFADALGEGTTPFARALATEWRQPPSLLAFLRDADYQLSTLDDDRTVVAVWSTVEDSTPS